VKKYKLIKTYPGMKYDPSNLIFSTDPDRANYPEFWEEVKVNFKIGDWVKVIPSNNRSTKYSEAIADNYIFRLWYDPENIDSFNSWVNGDCSVLCVDKDNKYSVNYRLEDLRLATKEEIEYHLIQEAKKRGYVTGTVINSISTVASLFKWTVNCDAGYRYYPNEDRLDCMRTERDANCTIYHKGQWAEIVKEEEIKIDGYNTKIEDNMFWVGCRSFSFEKIKELYSIICYFGIESISIRNTKVTPDIVKKVLDKIDRQ